MFLFASFFCLRKKGESLLVNSCWLHYVLPPLHSSPLQVCSLQHLQLLPWVHLAEERLVSQPFGPTLPCKAFSITDFLRDCPSPVSPPQNHLCDQGSPLSPFSLGLSSILRVTDVVQPPIQAPLSCLPSSASCS